MCRKFVILTFACVLMLAGSASAATPFQDTYIWTDADAGDHNWTTAGNWDACDEFGDPITREEPQAGRHSGGRRRYRRDAGRKIYLGA